MKSSIVQKFQDKMRKLNYFLKPIATKEKILYITIKSFVQILTIFSKNFFFLTTK